VTLVSVNLGFAQASNDFLIAALLIYSLAVLAFAGGSIAILDHVHGWVTKLAIAVVVCTWSWIAWQRWRTGRRITRVTAALIIVATLLTATSASWPLIEPAAFHALGIVKKKAVRASE